MKKLFISIIVGAFAAVAAGFWLASIAPKLRMPEFRDTQVAQHLRVGTTDPVQGTGTPKVTIIEAASFTCPACREVAQTLNQLIGLYPGAIRLVWKDLPQDNAASVDAAIAARCAQQQGKFWQYHDRLYLKQDLLGAVDLYDEWALDLGLDQEKFTQCRRDGTGRRLVDLSTAEGLARNITSIPYFEINQTTVLQGARNLVEFRNVVDSILKQ